MMRTEFSFIDLFAGIGGMRLAAEAVGGRCVFSSEINKHARTTYAANFGEEPAGDIREIPGTPLHDVLLAGFPCQPFSISGVKRGFEDSRGTLFHEVARIIAARRPALAILENVKFLTVHDGGRTLATILRILREGLGYHVSYAVLNAANFGLPQSRERIVIVASRDRPFDFPVFPALPRRPVADILDDGSDVEYLDPDSYVLLDASLVRRVPGSGLVFCGYRKANLRQSGARAADVHFSRTHKQQNRIYRSDGSHPTLSAGESTGRYFVLHEGRVRRMGVGECFRLQGFPDDFIKPCTRNETLRQLGNSVPIQMIEAVLREAIGQCLDAPLIEALAA